MSEQKVSIADPGRIGRSVLISVGAGLLTSAAIIGLALGGRGLSAVAEMAAATDWTPHAPRLGLIARAPLAVQVHLATIIPAFVIGGVQMLGPKGRTLHRMLGWTFTVLMTVTAIAGLMIPNRTGGFNLLYVFSFITLATLPIAILAARRGNLARHARSMGSLYIGGLVFAGLLASLPGRLLWAMLFH